MLIYRARYVAAEGPLCCLLRGEASVQNTADSDSFSTEPGSILMPSLEVLVLSKDALPNLEFQR